MFRVHPDNSGHLGLPDGPLRGKSQDLRNSQGLLAQNPVKQRVRLNVLHSTTVTTGPIGKPPTVDPCGFLPGSSPDVPTGLDGGRPPFYHGQSSPEVPLLPVTEG